MKGRGEEDRRGRARRRKEDRRGRARRRKEDRRGRARRREEDRRGREKEGHISRGRMQVIMFSHVLVQDTESSSS